MNLKSRCMLVGFSGAPQGRQTVRNNHKPSDVVNGVTAVAYRVCLRKPSNDGNCEPTLGAGGRRFKSCLPDQHKPLEIAVSGFAAAGDWLSLLASCSPD